MNTYWELINIYILSCFQLCSNRNKKLSVSFVYFIFGLFEFFQFIVHCMLGIERVIINPSTQWTLSRQLKIKGTTCKHTKKYKLFFFFSSEHWFQIDYLRYLPLSPLSLSRSQILSLSLSRSRPLSRSLSLRLSRGRSRSRSRSLSRGRLLRPLTTACVRRRKSSTLMS